MPGVLAFHPLYTGSGKLSFVCIHSLAAANLYYHDDKFPIENLVNDAVHAVAYTVSLLP